MNVRRWSSIRSIIWPCWNRRHAPSIRQRHLQAGSCRSGFAQLRRLLEARLKKHGARGYVQVLRLLETFTLEEVTHTVEDALHLGTISFDAVRHLLLCRIERRPPRLDMQNYPHLPLAQVRPVSGPARACGCFLCG